MQRRLRSHVIAALILGGVTLAAVGCRHDEAAEAPAGVAAAGDIPLELCHAQSPINILTGQLDRHSDVGVRLHYQAAEEVVANLGHTVQVSFAPGSSLEFEGEVYEFQQFHFHTPAEHQVDGITYPMEMHMVHTLRGTEQTYLVVAVWFKDGPSNPFLDSFIAAIPPIEGGRVTAPPGAVDITGVVAPDEPYFHYAGSLTTPPYTESVTWMIAERPREASEAQIATFRAMEGRNARVVQARNGRHVDEI